MKIPFSDLDSQSWRKLGYAASFAFLFLLYLTQTISMIRNQEIGMDYLGFWSAGRVADDYGYSSIYDTNLLLDVQTQALEKAGILIEGFHVYPVAYPSVFILPFQFLSRVNLVSSYWLWVSINWLVLIYYLIFFTRKVNGGFSDRYFTILTAVALVMSYPTMFNFMWGQVEVLLVVCLGEFIRHSSEKKTFLAGLWLGVLVIKPQLLILILPALLFLRKFDLFKGILCSGIVLSATSVLLSGWDGIRELYAMWVGFLPGVATNSPQGMMNWRMAAIRLQQILPSTLSWVIAICGVAATLAACCMLLRRKPEYGSKGWIIVMTGIFAATCAVTWHSHVHMAMILLPFFIYGITNGCVSLRLVDTWIFITPALFLVLFLIGMFSSADTASVVLSYAQEMIPVIWLILNLLCIYYVERFSR